MNIRRLVVAFATVFVVALAATVIETFLWTFIGHGEGTIDWDTSFRLAPILGSTLTWAGSRKTREQSRLPISGITEGG